MAEQGADAERVYLRGLIEAPTRADARRNHAALLAAAGEVFGRDGPDASLDEIAVRAGVGNATLYRHFPTRRDLLVAVSVAEVEALCRLADRLRSAKDPGQALVTWLRAYVEHVSSRQGLGAAITAASTVESKIITACRQAVEHAGSTLLQPAQRSGAIRSELTLSDLLTLANAVATAAETPRTAAPGHADRLLDLVLYGIVAPIANDRG